MKRQVVELINKLEEQKKTNGLVIDLANTTAQNLNSTAATLTIASALPPYQRGAHSIYNRRQFLSSGS